MGMMEVKLNLGVKSLAIHAVDDFTAPVDFMYKEYYESDLNIGISHGAHRVKASQQGIYYYTNLPGGDYSVTLKSPRFVTEEKTFSITTGSLTEISARMKPGYDYKFYGDTAFIRGTVIDSATNRPVQGIRALALPRNEEAYTDEKGRFMLYFKDPILIAGEQISVTFQDAAFQSATVNVDMVQRQKTTMDTVALVKV
ncbi:MAG: hypothetical protein ABUK01_19255 [Leptospirales bacterium]